MKKDLLVKYLVLMFVANSCFSQQTMNDEVIVTLQKSINRIEFSKLAFFAKELIEMNKDTSFQSKFAKKIEQHDKMKPKTIADQKELDLTLHLLYQRIAAEKVTTSEHEKSKFFLLNRLAKYREIKFSVDGNLILEQIDVSKRGMIHGYDEGSIGKSMFVFFCNDPLLYKTALFKSGSKDEWERMGTFLCNYLRENENPMPIRNPIKEGIISMLNRPEIKDEFTIVVKELVQCDVSINLND